jgi:acetylcholinesterase
MSVPNHDISRPSLAFGFLASQEVKDAGIGNLGLHDRQFRTLISPVRSKIPDRLRLPERAALRWVQEHIESFGGDPTKVTM